MAQQVSFGTVNGFEQQTENETRTGHDIVPVSHVHCRRCRRKSRKIAFVAFESVTTVRARRRQVEENRCPLYKKKKTVFRVTKRTDRSDVSDEKWNVVDTRQRA